MGLNKSRVSNETSQPVYITTYNYRDSLYWIYRSARQVPADGSDVAVDGMAGGNAIQVAVIYNTFVDKRQFVCDLFSVKNGSSLTIKGLTQGAGVTSYSGEGVERLVKGKVITLDGEQSRRVSSILLQTIVPMGLNIITTIIRTEQARAQRK